MTKPNIIQITLDTPFFYSKTVAGKNGVLDVIIPVRAQTGSTVQSASELTGIEYQRDGIYILHFTNGEITLNNMELTDKVRFSEKEYKLEEIMSPKFPFTIDVSQTISPP